MRQGLRIPRRFTRAGEDPYDSVEWTRRDSRIANPDGSVVFEQENAEVPAGWSRVASDILVSKYFRKAGVPQEDGTTGPERSARQVFDRLAETWRWWGQQHGYFATDRDADAFEDEMKHMLCHQVGAPNSPQWFNTGLHRAYGLTGPPQGFWYVNPETEQLEPSPDSYSRPAPHACFILKVEDDLVNDGGIMDLWLREARVFKFGSGAGTNFSDIRAEGEKLSGGGESSGVMSFLKIGDRAAGAIKSGGTTRRAAKMVILDIDHPDIEEFIRWKKTEEDKARVLIDQGGFPADFNGEAYATVSGQNSNNSVRVCDDFINAVRNSDAWDLTARTTGKVMKTVPAERLWESIAEAAWDCADPGVQFDTTINEWHTCPEGGPIRGSNPCSEYMFLDDTACNLASLNLVAFYDHDTDTFDTGAYLHAVRLWTVVLEISVTMAHFPSEAIARGSYDYRTLGLGYANLGSLLMRKGIPYDSAEGRAVAAALTSILTGAAYAASAEMASVLGPFPRYRENRQAMLRVIRNHRRAAYDEPHSEYEGVSRRISGIDRRHCPEDLARAARGAWDRALTSGREHGFRNAQVSVLAPTGCLVGGSLVPTERGLVRLRSLGDPHGDQWQPLDVAVGTDEGPREASRFYVNGPEPVVTVETEHGHRIRGTPTHRIRVVNPRNGEWTWKRFADLEPGDIAPLQKHQLVGDPREAALATGGNGFPAVMTPALAEFLAYWTKGGKVTDDGVELWSSPYDPALAHRVEILGKELFGVDNQPRANMGFVESRFRSSDLVVWWKKNGFDSATIPDSVLASNDPRVYRAFLRGLLQPSHAPRASKSLTVGLPTVMACEVQSLMMALGYPTVRRGGTIVVPEHYAGRFVKETGIVTDLQFLDDHEGGFFYDHVEHVSLGEEQFTYDLSVPDNTTYVANGFVSHNTIGLLMDCDTTGVEPDFALVKFKKLAGGGHFKIVNRSVGPALDTLGYTPAEQKDIIDHVIGSSSLGGAPHVNRGTLRQAGFTDSELDRIESSLPEVFELRHAFNVLAVGEPTLRRLGVDPGHYEKLDFDLLAHLGFTDEQIEEASDRVCGRHTIEAAPHLREEHLSVFDTANRNGKHGQRFIHHNGHIKMMAAAQPFISGAISKTINMPQETQPSDMRAAYDLSWSLGLKAIALYRDGSKASQPLSVVTDDSDDETPELDNALAIEHRLAYGPLPEGTSPSEAYAQGMKPPRFLLASRRKGWTQEARVGGHKLFIRTGEYEDGTLGELFIDLAKEGATLRGILSCFAIAVSKGLQYGVPLEEFVDTFIYQTFEPRGMVQQHPNIKMASSMVDYIFRALAIEYLGRDDLGQVPDSALRELPEDPHPAVSDRGTQLPLDTAPPRGGEPAAVGTAVPAVAGVHSDNGVAPSLAPQNILGKMMGDAPMCDECGHITVRNGSCYRCLNCGASLGCS